MPLCLHESLFPRLEGYPHSRTWRERTKRGLSLSCPSTRVVSRRSGEEDGRLSLGVTSTCHFSSMGDLSSFLFDLRKFVHGLGPGRVYCYCLLVETKSIFPFQAIPNPFHLIEVLKVSGPPVYREVRCDTSP